MEKILFVHFIGEQPDGEQIYFSVSQNGRHFKELNAGQPVLHSTIGEEGVRDPFILRDPHQQKFYLLATDLRIEKGLGWNAAQNEGSQNIVIWESTDLIYWSEPWLLPIDLPTAGNVWAPEAFYDEAKQAFLVFWASKIDGKHRIYAAYTTDFRELSQPFVFLERENDVIDTTIVEDHGYFYRFSKDETTSRIIVERSSELTGDYQVVPSPVLEKLAGVEGPELYQIEDEWYFIVDRFAEDKGYMLMRTAALGEEDFTILTSEEYDFGQTKKRHGGVMAITTEEYQRLLTYYDQQNPVISGLHADPDLVKFGDEYFIYPTNDGQPGWGSDRFNVFRSKDLYHFTDAGEILNFANGDVPWAVSNAWAPCIAEKAGQYYYYFCGKRPDGQSCIGVAVATEPTGPFTAADQPLLTPEIVAEAGLEGIHQVIDPAIYQEDDQTYLLFGNGVTGAICQLTAEMTEVLPASFHQFEGLVDFREAVEVFKRDGLYHFTWSCDDTGNENYHVNYGIAPSLFGPIEFQYPILQKAPAKNIFGTGHHSIFKEPTVDRFWIAYHRFATPLKNYPVADKGWNREVCISPLDFTDEGLLRPVIL